MAKFNIAKCSPLESERLQTELEERAIYKCSAAALCEEWGEEIIKWHDAGHSLNNIHSLFIAENYTNVVPQSFIKAFKSYKEKRIKHPTSNKR